MHKVLWKHIYGAYFLLPVCTVINSHPCASHNRRKCGVGPQRNSSLLSAHSVCFNIFRQRCCIITFCDKKYRISNFGTKTELYLIVWQQYNFELNWIFWNQPFFFGKKAYKCITTTRGWSSSLTQQQPMSARERESERARESQREPERARESKREQEIEPEWPREGQGEPEMARL